MRRLVSNAQIHLIVEMVESLPQDIKIKYIFYSGRTPYYPKFNPFDLILSNTALMVDLHLVLNLGFFKQKMP